MSDEFSFPGLTLDENDPDSRFLDLFNRFSGQYPNTGQYLKPDDPDLQAYQKLATEPTGSEDLIKHYIESMPTREEYSPSFGNKMVATLIGALAGDPTKGFALARNETQRPYMEAVNEWKMEGSNIGARARLMDAERQRQLQAMRYGLQTKAGTAKSESQQEFRRLQEARRIANEIAAEEAKNRDVEDRENERDFRRNITNQIFNQKKDMDEWRKNEHVEDDTARDEARKARDEVLAAKASSLDQINKKLSAYASQQGIDTTKMTALDVAKSIAFQRAKANPAFGDLISQDEGGNWIATAPKYGSDRERILRIYIDNLTQKLLKGEF